MAGQLLRLLTGLGIEVHCFTTQHEEAIPPAIRLAPGLRFVCVPSGWKYGQWYSRTDFTKFATGLPAQGLALVRLGAELAHRHSRDPFDLVYLFNAADVTALRGRLSSMPPIVLHPEVHARGELTWLRRERRLAARGAGAAATERFSEAAMMLRAVSQRRGIHKGALIIVPSRRFAQLLAADYGVPPGRIQVVPNPIDLQRFSPNSSAKSDRPHIIRLLYVSRIAVRKGVELMVDLSHRLADVEDSVRLEIVGDRSLWSDYSHLLAHINLHNTTYKGAVRGSEVDKVMQGADVFICPSHYEPFGLTVGEALASGLPVVASDAVGATEDVGAGAVETFSAGDPAALEAAVRVMIERFRSEPAELRAAARREAERLFSPQTVAKRLRAALTAA